MDNNYITNHTSEEDKISGFVDIGELELGSEDKIYWLSEDQIKRHVSKLFMLSEVTSIKQDLYVTALNNLLKKNNFLELHQQLLNNEITDEEFDSLLNDNPLKYTIQMNKSISTLEKNVIVQIISQIESDIKEFSISDIEELFSIKYNCLSNSHMIKCR